jgi:hypothetical protein
MTDLITRIDAALDGLVNKAPAYDITKTHISALTSLLWESRDEITRLQEEVEHAQDIIADYREEYPYITGT